METIAVPLDFLGVNYYSRAVLRADDEGEPVAVSVVPTHELTDMGWEVYPYGLSELLVRVAREFRPVRIYITENGAAYPDGPDTDGVVRDRRRIDYLNDHLIAAHEAIAEGVPLGGYFVWSLLDNFEWALGYSKRFGIVHVDFDTQQRTPKDSARFYARVIASRGRVLNPGASTTDSA